MINPKIKRLVDSLEHDEKLEANSSRAVVLGMVGTGKRVLEFGCAAGELSRLLVAAGNSVTGIATDGSVADEARSACDEVVVADLDGGALAGVTPGRTFDVALFGNVLEHARDPRRLLEETRPFLAAGGCAIVSVPNVAHGSIRLALLRGRFDQPSEAARGRSYARFFTLETIHELCFRAGFRVVEIERIKSPVFPADGAVHRLKSADFEREILREIESDPEHDTVQFVVRAAPLGDEERLAALVEIAVESELRLNEVRFKLARSEAEREEFRQRAAESDERSARERSAREGLEAQVAALRESLAELQRRFELACAVADEANREREAGFVAREKAEAEIRRIQEELHQTNTAADRRAAALEDVRFALERETTKLRDLATTFYAHVEAELARTHREVLHVDGLIRQVQSSKFWTAKRVLGDVRRSVLAKLRR